MRKITKHIPLAVALFGSLAATQVATAAVSGNLGFSSEYVFRGVLQAPSSGSAGLDFSHDSGVYVGTWLGQVAPGVEYDLYAGYGGEYQGFSYDLNYTTYNYTDDTFDNDYKEFNIGLGYGPISVGYAQGKHTDLVSDVDLDYTATTVSLSQSGFTLLYGSNGKDFDGKWYEFGYSTTVGDFDTGINFIKSDKDLDDTEYLIFSVGKTIDIM